MLGKSHALINNFNGKKWGQKFWNKSGLPPARALKVHSSIVRQGLQEPHMEVEDEDVWRSHSDWEDIAKVSRRKCTLVSCILVNSKCSSQCHDL